MTSPMVLPNGLFTCCIDLDFVIWDGITITKIIKIMHWTHKSMTVSSLLPPSPLFPPLRALSLSVAQMMVRTGRTRVALDERRDEGDGYLVSRRGSSHVRPELDRQGGGRGWRQWCWHWRARAGGGLSATFVGQELGVGMARGRAVSHWEGQAMTIDKEVDATMLRDFVIVRGERVQVEEGADRGAAMVLAMASWYDI